MKGKGVDRNRQRWRAVAAYAVLSISIAACQRFRPSSSIQVQPLDSNASSPMSSETPAGELAGGNGTEPSPDEQSATTNTTWTIPPVAPVTLDREVLNPEILGEEARIAVGRDFKSVYFDSDSSDILFSTSRTLDEYARWLADHTDVLITLEGHCDRTGVLAFNFNLGMSRAWAVKQKLHGLGVSNDRLFTISHGEERPILQGRSRGELALNRRVEFLAFLAPKGGLRSIPTGSVPEPPPLREASRPPESIELFE